jgi:hypothetical protein
MIIFMKSRSQKSVPRSRLEPDILKRTDMFVTEHNFHYFSNVRFMKSPNDDTSVGC